MVHRHEQADIFDGAFDLFWRDPAAAQFDAAMAMLGDKAAEAGPAPLPGSRRVAEAIQRPPRPARDRGAGHRRSTPSFTVSDAGASADDGFRGDERRRNHRRPRGNPQAGACRWTSAAPGADRPATHGSRIDMAATLRAGLRHGGELMDLAPSRTHGAAAAAWSCSATFRGRWGRYAQILLHFLHAVANDRDRVSVFLFGTRLTNITRQLRHRDPEAAFAAVAAMVPDWSGGTRIGDTIAQFNRQWAKRVLGQGAVVLLVTDGLDRAGADGLPEAMERLHKSCRRLIWLNPLLRWDGFEPKSQGIRAMLPHVDEFRPVHNIASLRALITALSRPAPARGRLQEFAA